MSICNWQIQTNYWNTIITRGAYSHPDKLYYVILYYSTLEAHISKTKTDRNKQISDSDSWRYYIVTEGLYLYNWHTCTEGCAEARFYLPTYYLKGMEHVPNIFMSFDKYLFLEVINILI